MRLAPAVDGGPRDGQVREEGTREGEEGHARTQARRAAFGRLWEESHQPKTGDRDRTERSSTCRRQGPEEEAGRPQAEGGSEAKDRRKETALERQLRSSQNRQRFTTTSTAFSMSCTESHSSRE